MNKTLSPLGVVAIAALCGSACVDDMPTAPGDVDVLLTAYGPARIVAAPNTLLQPLMVVVTDARTGRPAADVEIAWGTAQNNGATLEVLDRRTDRNGVARAEVRLGPELGTHIVEAWLPYGPVTRIQFELESALAPEIASIEPLAARAGQTVIIRGRNFHRLAEQNGAYFGELRATIMSSAPDRLEVVVPLCLVERTVQVTVRVSTLSSQPAAITVIGGGTPLTLDVGDVSKPFQAGDDCLRLHGGAGGARYLLLSHNVSSAVGDIGAFELSAMHGARGSIELPEHRGPQSVARRIVEDPELRIRARDAELFRRYGARRKTVAAYKPQAVPATVGSKRIFQVLKADGSLAKVQTKLRLTSVRANIYQDVAAPGGGLTDEEIEQLGTVFDDVIYPTDVQVFGAPSDVDFNGKINIVLTPVVNAWTPASDTTGFFSGFFNGCDLYTPDTCEGSNESETLYVVVPDPDGLFGLRHPRAGILNLQANVIAHEFQHAIHANQRYLVAGASELEADWLMEGLAHMAEDTVGGVLLQRGDLAGGALMRRPNLIKAYRLLRDPSHASVVEFDNYGTLEQRGAAWLLVKYLSDRFGGRVLADVCRSTKKSVALLTSTTQTPWEDLVNDWWLAIYAAGDPGFALSDRIAGYDGFDLRSALAAIAPSAPYPLKPMQLNGGDARLSGTLAPSAAAFAEVTAATANDAVNLVLTAPGRALQNPKVRLTIVRVR